MAYLYIKALHVIFVVCWFAGLFYIVRLFVYYAEAQSKDALEKEILTKQYRIMTNRLWVIITYPAAILATLFGVLMFFINPALLKMPWMHMKLFFVVLLWIYHFACQSYVNQIGKDALKKTSSFFRIWNEGATLILFAVIFIVILKSTFDWVFGVVGLVGLSILLMIGIKLYKKAREAKK